jgi:copper homeostasis protein
LLEICCDSFADAREAQRGGADRVELCSALWVGGLTPSAGAIAECKQRLQIPVVVMIRPRSGGFCYSKEDFAVMERDVREAVRLGADGVVFGALRKDAQIDRARCARLLELAGKCETVFHRAFDLTPDAGDALETLIDLGFTRVLTSGHQATAVLGTEGIRELVDQAAGRIEILPGSGIRRNNVGRLVRETGCDQVHMSAFRIVRDGPEPKRSALRIGRTHAPSEGQHQQTARDIVRSVVAELRKN